MLRRLALAATAVALGALTPLPGGVTVQTPDHEAADVEAHLRERMAATSTPGLAYATFSSDGIQQLGAMGYDGDGAAVTPRTPFLWGSVSKPVTATLMMTLVETGTVDLDEPVRTYLPDFTLADTEDAGRITVRQLIEQTSGIPDGTGATDRFDHGDSPYLEAVAELAAVEPLFPPGERHEYSSANYVVLGAVVEAVTGQDFTRVLRANVLDPLGMTGAVTTPADARQRLPDGHLYAFGRAMATTPPYDVTGPSYGYLGGTIEDVARFAADQLAGHHGGSRILDSASIAELHTGTARISDTHHYGLGWRDDQRNADLGTGTVWHGGASPGYQAIVVLLPEHDRGIVVLQNIYGTFQDDDLVRTGLGAARMLAGGSPPAHDGDATYTLVLGGLGVILLAVATALGWGAYRLMRPAAGQPRRRSAAITTAAWVATGLGMAYLATQAPRILGGSLRLLPLYAPDVGWLLTAIIAAALGLAAVRLAAVLLALRSRPSHAAPADG